jgi:hypothetical protein
MAIPFLYTNSPGQLHYTFAYFLCGSTCQQKSGGSGAKPAGSRKAVVAESRASNFKSNRI